MRYLEFIKKIHDARANHQSLDDSWKNYNADEHHYLTQNIDAFPSLGGAELFLDHIAKLLKIESTDKKERDQRIHDSLSMLDDWHKAHQDQAADPELQLWQKMQYRLTHGDDGKAFERMQAVYPGGKKDVAANLEQVLDAGGGKIAHYFLHESPEKEAYRAALIHNLGYENFPEVRDKWGELPSMIKETLNVKSVDGVRAILTALPPEMADALLFRIHNINWKYGPDIAELGVEYYPRSQIDFPPFNPQAFPHRYQRMRRNCRLFLRHASFSLRKRANLLQGLHAYP